MKIKLTRISRKDQVSKTSGKPYVSLGLQCNEYGDKWLSGFGGKENMNWNVGDEVEVVVEQKGEYLNFSMPKPADQIAEMQKNNSLLEAKIDAIHDTLKQLVAYVTKNEPKPVDPGVEYPAEVHDPKDIPF